MRGKLLLSCVLQPKPFGYHRYLMGTRSNPKQIMTWEWIPEISPSPPLREWTLKKKSEQQWNEQSFREFECRYKQELLEDTKQSTLLQNLLQEIEEGKRIVLGCYCRDGLLCHRKVIGDWFRERGCTVEYR